MSYKLPKQSTTTGKRDAADGFANYLRGRGCAVPETEHLGIPKRKFRFDLAWPDAKAYVEINGGNWVGGRHARAAALDMEYEKNNLATLNGWRGLTFSTTQIDKDPERCLEQILMLLGRDVRQKDETNTEVTND